MAIKLIHKTKAEAGADLWVREFSSINEYVTWCDTQPENEAFKGKHLSSKELGDTGFYGTYSFDEAQDLLSSGWTQGAERLTQVLKATPSSDTKPIVKQVLDVCGANPVVPLFLSGVPVNMQRPVRVQPKQKVVTITRLLTVAGSIKKSEIEREGIKFLSLIQRLEALGVRCNVNAMWSGGDSPSGNGKVCAFKVRIKSANERFNIAKMAYPLAHTSFVRRHGFRYLEVAPEVTHDIASGYGYIMVNDKALNALCGNGEICLRWKISQDISKIQSIGDIKSLTYIGR